MSMHYLTVVLFAVIVSVIKTANPTVNTCKYNSTTFPTDNTDCVKTRMANGFACCYEQYTEGSTTYKLCVKEELNKTRNAETIKNEFTGTLTNVDVKCPTSSSIPNNCGIIGINAPSTLEECSNITIPESYCCMVTHSGGNSCRRLDYYPSKNDKNEELKNEIHTFGEELISVECNDKFKHYATTLLLLTLLFVVFDKCYITLHYIKNKYIKNNK